MPYGDFSSGSSQKLGMDESLLSALPANLRFPLHSPFECGGGCGSAKIPPNGKNRPLLSEPLDHHNPNNEPLHFILFKQPLPFRELLFAAALADGFIKGKLARFQRLYRE